MIRKMIKLSLLMTILFVFTGAYAQWQPVQGMTWDVQYEGSVNPGLNVQLRNVDLEDSSPELIAQMKANGQVVVCYFSAGSYENWRGDAWKFSASVKGRNLSGWNGEKWLDVRKLDILMPIMKARMADAVRKGCDGLDPDNMDGYANRTGFQITRAQSEAYFKALAEESHKLGLPIGLKNSMEMIPAVLPFMDFAVNEQCHQYKECGTYKPVTDAGMPVFGIEYKGDPKVFCPVLNARGHDTLMKTLSLNADRIDCKDYL